MLPLWKNLALCKEIPAKTNYMNTTMRDESHEEKNEKGSGEHSFHQMGAGNNRKDGVKLDNQNTLDQFVNAKYLTNIHTVKQQPIMVYCNASRQIYQILDTFLFGLAQTALQMFTLLKQLLIITWSPAIVMTGVDYLLFTPQKATLNSYNLHMVYS